MGCNGIPKQEFQSGISWHGVMKAILNLKREIMIFYSLKQCYGNNHNVARMCLLIGTVSQVSDLAHWPLVCLWFLGVIAS